MISDKRALYILPEIYTYSAQELVYAERSNLRSSEFSDGRAQVCAGRQGAMHNHVCMYTCVRTRKTKYG